jgi:hypothetical protein
VALRTEGSRLAQDANSAHRSVAGERWFDKVRDGEPLDQLASAAPSPARTLSSASLPPAGTLTDAELAVQQPGAHAARRHVSADHAGGPRDVFGDGARGRPGTVRGQYRRQRAASSCDRPGCGPGRGPGHCCWHVARAALRGTAAQPSGGPSCCYLCAGEPVRDEAGAIIAAVLITGVTTLCPGSRSRAGPRVGLQRRRRSVPAGGAGPTSCRSTRRFLDSDRALRAWAAADQRRA